MSLFEVNDKGNVVVYGYFDCEMLLKNFWDSLDGNECSILINNKRCFVDLSDVECVDSVGLVWFINVVRDVK